MGETGRLGDRTAGSRMKGVETILDRLLASVGPIMD